MVADAREIFYHDLPEEEEKEWVSRHTKQLLKTLTEGDEHTHAERMDIPVWCLATKEDKGLPLEVQKMLVQMANDATVDIILTEMESSHSPM